MADASNDWGKHKKAYYIVGGALFILTGLTLALGLVDFLDVGRPGVDGLDIFIGLVVATTKCSLVALIFMHLNHERGMVYKVLLFTFIFFLSLMFLTLFAGLDPIVEQFDTLSTTSGKVGEGL